MAERFKTHHDIARWIIKNVDFVSCGCDTVEDAILWWQANRIADEMRDFDQRELAQTVLEGMQPITLEDLDTELAEMEEEEDNDTIEASLKDFWLRS